MLRKKLNQVGKNLGIKLLFNPIKADKIDLLIIAGEASGDEHSAQVVKNVLRLFPNHNIVAIGGNNLKKSGANFLFDLVDHAVVGIFEVLKNYWFFKSLFSNTLRWIIKNKPKVILLVDYPGFNLRLAEALRKKGISQKGGGNIKVLQYISPQLWAWKPKRRFKMANVLDGLAVIFPFEVDCYKDVDLPVIYVGHPYVSSSFNYPVKFDRIGPLLLLPGSRVQPVQRLLPVFLETAQRLLEIYPQLKISLPVPNKTIEKIADEILSQYPDIRENIKITIGISGLSARLALMSSGTVSFACALSGIPGVIAYRAHPITYFLGRLLINVPFLGMANLILRENPPYPEFIQDKANAKILCSALLEILAKEKGGNGFLEVAKKLKENLKEPHGLGVVDWLSAEADWV